MLELKTFLFVCLSLGLPARWQSDRPVSSVHTGPVPGTRVQETLQRWHSADGKAFVQATYWSPGPWHDGGPMVAESSWKRKVAGESVTVTQTSQFMGLKQRVLVTHLHPKNPPAVIMIYARGVHRQDFERYLDTVRYTR